METKVLSAIMKLQAAQIMLSNEGIHATIETHVTKYGSIELTAYTKDESKGAVACQILDAYTFLGAKFNSETYHNGEPNEFTSYSLLAYISEIQD